MTDSLTGIRVLDVTFYLPGPYAAKRLGDMGAEVIKIEPPGGDPAAVLSGGHVYGAVNSGKEIIRLDLKSEEGQTRMTELVRSADVLIESFRPGVMHKFGFHYEAVKNIKPDLVYCSLSGYGQSGPLAHLGSHDLNYLAISGSLLQMAGRYRSPVPPVNTFADYIGGLVASEQILGALVKRFKTGAGAYVDIALADAAAQFQIVHDQYSTANVSDIGIPEIAGTAACYSVYETADGRHVTLGALEGKFWRNFCEFAEEPEWQEYGFASEESPEYQEIAAYFKTKTWREWYDISMETDCCLAPVLMPHERHEHPFYKQLNAR
ncbi:CaiB/BaiF CoA transferase family protein [Planococcus lenghuensis]|uniref:CoA transferase n=1 Tax=Planococcus lenghuensis TaxID=2213202 RepID=A0A1Q2KVE6_9BACL|nr:CaiB/BaiF CoA-transferase family protein [Planococcus lenghuensis]AQQ52084.1 CoA transferase [Planococcus lenghuensis]